MSLHRRKLITVKSIRPVIDTLTFRFASTMPEIPHEYTVRGVENEAAYVALFNAIQEHGRTEWYKGHPKKYLYPGDGWKYWAMTTELGWSRVINRMKIEDDLERLCREGQASLRKPRPRRPATRP